MSADARTTDSTHVGAAANAVRCALVGLQFFAIAWIALNQFRNHLGLEAGLRSGLVAKGYIGAGLYFVAGGYLLADSYARQRSVGQLRYAAFLWRRLAFLYPLHLVVLAGMAAGLLFGAPTHRASFELSDIPANLLLIQGWGVTSGDSWNFPSWLISADWFAYVTYPVTAWAALKLLRPGAIGVGVSLVLFVAMFLLAEREHILFTDLTTIGAVQTIPAMLLGSSLWRLRQDLKLSPRLGGATALLAFGWILAAATLRASDLAIWPAFAPLALGLAIWATSRPPSDAWLGTVAFLGRIPVAMQLVYLPVDIGYFRFVKLVLGAPTGASAWLALAGVFPAILLAAVAAHQFIQRPIAKQADRWLSRIESSRASA